MKPFFFTILFTMLAACLCGAQSEITLDNKEAIIYKDSTGSIITSKQATDLLKTGKYISEPAMNEFLQMEHVIRKPRKEDGDRYQTYSHGETIISTSGIKNPGLKYNLGDTLPPINVSDFMDEHFANHQLPHEITLLLFYKTNDLAWSDMQSATKSLIADYPKVNFVICSQQQGKTLTDFLDKKTLRLYRSVFLAEPDFSEKASVQNYPLYLITDRTGKLLMFVPAFPRPEITIHVLRKYFSSITKG